MKKIAIVVSFICVVSISFAFIKDEKPHYENLKVLPKDITKQALDSVMKHFTASLGVRCTYCHVRNTDEMKSFNFASDENPKKGEARDMYKMMEKINKKYFKEDNEKSGNMIPEVSCFTCHHGQEEPANRPVAMAPPPPPPHP